MADKSNGWGNLISQGGIANYPLMGLLAGTYAKGHAYQSQLTPYKREAKGDWARALDESLNQYFSQLPGYYQQVRANKLQQQQLAQQKIKQGQQQQLFDLQMQEHKRAEQQRKNYPKMVASLPIAETAKKHLLTLPPKQGTQLMQTFMTEFYKSSLETPDPKGRLLNAQELQKTGYPKGTFWKPDGTPGFPTEGALDYMQQAGGVDDIKVFQNNYAGKDNSYSKVVSISQLPGERIEERKLNAVALLPAGHTVRVSAEDEFVSDSWKATANFVFIPEKAKGGVRPLGGQAKENRFAQIKVPEEQSLSGLAQHYRAKGFPVSEDVLFALNPDHFVKVDGVPDRNQLLTYDQTKEPFKVPETKVPIQLGGNEISSIQAQSKSGTHRIPGLGMFITNKTMKYADWKEVNDDYNTAKVFVDSIEQMLVAVTQPGATNPAQITANAGKVKTLHRRLMRIQQAISKMGVLSPGEIPYLEETVPSYQSFINWMLSNDGKPKGKKAFLDAVYQELRADALVEMGLIRDVMAKYNETPVERASSATIAEFEIPKLDPTTELQGAGLD